MALCPRKGAYCRTDTVYDGHKTFIEELQQIDEPVGCTNARSVSSSAGDVEDEQLPKEELSPQEIFEECTSRPSSW